MNLHQLEKCSCFLINNGNYSALEFLLEILILGRKKKKDMTVDECYINSRISFHVKMLLLASVPDHFYTFNHSNAVLELHDVCFLCKYLQIYNLQCHQYTSCCCSQLYTCLYNQAQIISCHLFLVGKVLN